MIQFSNTVVSITLCIVAISFYISYAMSDYSNMTLLCLSCIFTGIFTLWLDKDTDRTKMIEHTKILYGDGLDFILLTTIETHIRPLSVSVIFMGLIGLILILYPEIGLQQSTGYALFKYSILYLVFIKFMRYITG